MFSTSYKLLRDSKKRNVLIGFFLLNCLINTLMSHVMKKIIMDDKNVKLWLGISIVLEVLFTLSGTLIQGYLEKITINVIERFYTTELSRYEKLTFMSKNKLSLLINLKINLQLQKEQ